MLYSLRLLGISVSRTESDLLTPLKVEILVWSLGVSGYNSLAMPVPSRLSGTVSTRLIILLFYYALKPDMSTSTEGGSA